MDDRIGSIEKGKCADIIAVSFDKPHMWPVYYKNPNNIIEQIVYSANASDVITTVVDGKVLMDNYIVKTLDESGALKLIQKQASELYTRTFSDSAGRLN